jgi:hypothetical protein
VAHGPRPVEGLKIRSFGCWRSEGWMSCVSHRSPQPKMARFLRSWDRTRRPGSNAHVRALLREWSVMAQGTRSAFSPSGASLSFVMPADRKVSALSGHSSSNLAAIAEKELVSLGGNQGKASALFATATQDPSNLRRTTHRFARPPESPRAVASGIRSAVLSHLRASPPGDHLLSPTDFSSASILTSRSVATIGGRRLR